MLTNGNYNADQVLLPKFTGNNEPISMDSDNPLKLQYK